MKKNEITVLLIIMLLVGLLMVMINPRSFLTINNLQSMAFQLPELGILSLAMMIVMLTGGINLSIIATANLSGITAALILASGGDQASGALVLLALGAALAVAAVVGLLNGVLVAYVGITPILATLGTMTLLNGFAIVITKGYVISGFPDVIRFIGNGTVLFIPFPLLIFIVMVLIMSVILNRTAAGFGMYMIGSNEIATKFSGISNSSVLIKTYVISG
ncbi:MAG: ABC transporter permease, partial [Spirochaetia bacterium]|nr:ABC transporter permease [Spirochaetia bacterium]